MTCIDPDRWTVPPESHLHWQSWGDEFVVYNSGSGDTHLLDPVAAEALQSLERQPVDLSELGRSVAEALEINLDDKLSAYLERLVSDFHRLGLVEPIE